MDFPNDFDTPVFSGARQLAVARTMAIWSAIAFFVAIALVGLFVWSANSLRMTPVLISINTDTGEWSHVSETSGRAREYTANHAMQESVVGNFARRWFTVSVNPRENDAFWCSCNPTDCARNAVEENRSPCLICCAAGGDLFYKFTSTVLPDWRERAERGESLILDEESIHANPIGEITDGGGLWHLTATLLSNMSEPRKIEAYVRIARQGGGAYPTAMGFYVANFNSYDTGPN